MDPMVISWVSQLSNDGSSIQCMCSKRTHSNTKMLKNCILLPHPGEQPLPDLAHNTARQNKGQRGVKEKRTPWLDNVKEWTGISST